MLFYLNRYINDIEIWNWYFFWPGNFWSFRIFGKAGNNSPTRFASLTLSSKEYTCIGQCVVIAESIQKASKLYGVSLLITSETRDKIKSLFHLRELDIIYVRGHAKAITIYEVLGHISNELPRDTVTSLICFELGLAEYRQKNWQIAISHFRKSFQLCNDKPSKMFIERCKAIQDDRYEIPALGWDHGWDMD